ncbi:hypothetical protein EYF80_044330 [Liparis tanakae]|uniref:Uncharacterized protein n=1 Tax=Liparis tanakae TaxID=230148 RepID=A0A4Z2FX05_9TELE|nr:hypothetical protein EYF80_044330 [Liparis tanakae]
MSFLNLSEARIPLGTLRPSQELRATVRPPPAHQAERGPFVNHSQGKVPQSACGRGRSLSLRMCSR